MGSLSFFLLRWFLLSLSELTGLGSIREAAGLCAALQDVQDLQCQEEE
jgi:hypothetical protein